MVIGRLRLSRMFEERNVTYFGGKLPRYTVSFSCRLPAGRHATVPKLAGDLRVWAAERGVGDLSRASVDYARARGLNLAPATRAALLERVSSRAVAGRDG